MQDVQEALHPSEPHLTELLKLQRKLFTQESTNENVQKLKALEAQIQRHIVAGEKATIIPPELEKLIASVV